MEERQHNQGHCDHGATTAVLELCEPVQLAMPGCEPIGPPTKRCCACGEFKPLAEYFSDRSRRDGLTRACRSCDAARHRKRWRENADAMRYRARKHYDANLIANRERAAERRRSERGRAINRLAVQRYRTRNSEKRAAHEIVSRAIASGALVRPDRCDMAHLGNCSGRIEAHHADYSRPLEIAWLCVEHHQASHRKPRTLPLAPLLQLLGEGEREGSQRAHRPYRYELREGIKPDEEAKDQTEEASVEAGREAAGKDWPAVELH